MSVNYVNNKSAIYLNYLWKTSLPAWKLTPSRSRFFNLKLSTLCSRTPHHSSQSPCVQPHRVILSKQSTPRVECASKDPQLFLFVSGHDFSRAEICIMNEEYGL